MWIKGGGDYAFDVSLEIFANLFIAFWAKVMMFIDMI